MLPVKERLVQTEERERQKQVIRVERERKSYKGKQRLMKGNTELWRERNGYKKQIETERAIKGKNRCKEF